ncbi:MAG: ATP-binding protein [Cyclobacteriaceae bacterium]
MRFNDIPGFTELKQHLVQAVEGGHLAHALLFAGQNGAPNLNLALAFAAFLNCDNRQHDDSCGACPSCSKNSKFVHPDLHFVFPVSSTKNVKGKDAVSASFLKDWRKFLQEQPFGNLQDWSNYYGGENKEVSISREESRHIIRNLSLKAFEGKFKIMLIWLPEMMHVTAANAILKILEEPPQDTIFLLVSNDAENLLTTILSRTQQFNIRKFHDQEIIDYLIATGIAADKAAQLSHLADGNLNQAMKLAMEVEDDSHQLFRDWMRLCYVKDYSKMVAWAELFQKQNRMQQKSVFQYGLNILREVLVISFAGEKLSRLSGDEKDFVQNFAKVMDANKIDVISNLLNQAYYHIERNANQKITFLDLSLQVAKAIRN